jgi:hypothetical protein
MGASARQEPIVVEGDYRRLQPKEPRKIEERSHLIVDQVVVNDIGGPELLAPGEQPKPWKEQIGHRVLGLDSV